MPEFTPKSAIGRYRFPFLLGFGITATALTGVLAARILWEQTSLTWKLGPQMIGFSLAHGYYAPLLLAPILMLTWLIVAIIRVSVIRVSRKLWPSTALWITLGCGLLALGLLSIPEAVLHYVFANYYASSLHANAIAVDDAFEGNSRAAVAMLKHGVPVVATDHEGHTILEGAATGGSPALVQWLLDRGADPNAVDLYGDSALERAIGAHRNDTAELLRSHGARQIKGSDEQRQAAAHQIVEEDIKRMNSTR